MTNHGPEAGPIIPEDVISGVKPQFLGSKLKPLEVWLTDNGVSPLNANAGILRTREWQVMFMMRLYHQEFDILPEIGVSGRSEQTGLTHLTLHVKLPEEVLTDINRRSALEDRLVPTSGNEKVLFDRFLADFRKKGVVVGVNVVEELPTSEPDFIGILAETEDEKAQRDYGLNLVLELEEKYEPVRDAFGEFETFFGESMHGIARRPIYEQNAIAHQIAEMAAKLREAIAIAEKGRNRFFTVS